MSRKSKKRGGRRPNIPEVTLRRYGSVKAEAGEQAGSRSGEFQPDYSHVVKDLRRIGLLATLFIGLLIALSFILG